MSIITDDLHEEIARLKAKLKRRSAALKCVMPLIPQIYSDARRSEILHECWKSLEEGDE